MREAGIQEFFAEGKIIPLTVVYEDFIQRYEQTVRDILDFLGLDGSSVKIAPAYFSQTSDEVTEQWVQRFRQEYQVDWTHQGW